MSRAISTTRASPRLPAPPVTPPSIGYEAQTALGLLLAYYGVSCSLTLGLDTSPTFSGSDIVSAPLAFHFSPTAHRLAQSLQWNRMMRVLDGLISLLKRRAASGV